MIIEEKSKTKYVLIAVIVLVLLIVAGFVYQQKTIMNLKQEITGKNAAGLNGGQGAAKNSPFTVQAVQKNLEDNTKEIRGTIISKTGNSLSVEAEIVDFSKLSGLTEDQLHQSASSFPKTKKKYEVSVSDKTQITSLKLGDLSAGMIVLVESEDLVYKSDNLSASKITVIGKGDGLPAGASLEEQSKQMKSIVGKIKEINDKYLVMGVTFTDYSKVNNSDKIDTITTPKIYKDYKVFFDGKTQFADKKMNELKVGDSICAYSPDSVYLIIEFTATKIEEPTRTESGLPSFPGQVIEKGDKVLTVRASGAYEGKTYKVKMLDITTILKLDHANNPPTQTEIGFSDILVNDQVWILARNDIEGKTEIDAIGVSVQINQ